MSTANNIWTKAEHYFSPIDFAMVMATGILSIAALLEGYTWLAGILYYIDIFLFLILLVFMLRRVVFQWDIFWEDLKSYKNGPSVFTFVVALCIIGNQAVLFNQWYTFARFILVFAFASWLFINYSFFFSITITSKKESLKDGINGSWLLSVVAIQALAILTVYTSEHSDAALFLASCLFFTGCVFYLYLMSLIIYRISFFELHAEDLGAAYWINMGATAITALAGSLLVLNGKNVHHIAMLSPFIKGLTLMFWSAGTWWIPLLIMLGIWRHVIRKVKAPITARGYSPTYWAFVFPLGMYTASSFRLSEMFDVPFLMIIPRYFFFIALFTWCALMVGLTSRLLTPPRVVS